LEEGLLKEVQNNFLDIYSFVKNILDEEIASINPEKLEDGLKIVVEQEDLYEDWVEKIETAPLPIIEKIEEIEHGDGIHLKVIYSLKVEEAKQIRKIKIKSNGKVEIFNYIETYRNINGKKFKVKIEYDTYGNLIFTLQKEQG